MTPGPFCFSILLIIKTRIQQIIILQLNLPYLSLDTITRLQSCPLSQHFIDETVEVKVNLFHNRIILKIICLTL